MNYWIIPANPNLYRLEDILNERNTIDWRQHNNFEIGDIVYIYISRPKSKIMYKMEVIAVNLKAKESIADRIYWINPSDFDISINHNRFFRMVFIAENVTNRLILDELLEHGLKGAPQGALKVKEPLLSYLSSIL